MNIVQRHSELVNEFLGNEKLSLTGLAEKFNISERTLRNDIQGLQDLFTQKNLIQIVKGYIEIPDKLALEVEFNEVVERNNFYHYKLSNEERVYMAVLLILYNDNYITTSYLANKLSVSKSTMAKEIVDIKKYLEDREIKLIAKTKKGYTVIGDELQIRNTISELSSLKGLKGGEDVNGIGILIEKELEGGVNRKVVRQVLLNYELLYNIELRDACFKEIENYIIIVMNRMIINKVVGKTHPTKGNNNQRIAYEILSELMDKYNINERLTQEEVMLFKEKIDEASFEKNQSNSLDEEIVNTEMQISAFVWAVCMSLDIKEKIGYQSYDLLLKHIMSTIISLKKYEIMRKNPLCSELEEMYPEVFEHVEKYIGIIERIINKKMNKDEISFIVMHIAATLENLRLEPIPIHALLICPAGLCTANLLKVKLDQNFNIVIDAIIPAHRLANYDRKGIDLVISTVQIRDSLNDIICINPLLYEDDIRKIRQYIDENNLGRKCKNKAEKREINRILSYIDEYNKIMLNKHENHSEKLELLNKKYSLKIKDNEKEIWFFEKLDESRMILDSEVDNWEESIRLAGKVLENHRDSTKEYTDKMIELVRRHGPYIVFAPGIAIAHASPRDGAKNLGVSFIRLKKPVIFNHDLNDPVRFVIGVSIPDEKSHLIIFFHMVRCMANNDIQGILYNAKTKTDIINIVKLYELYQFDKK